MRALLAGLAPRRTVLLIPTVPGQFLPGFPVWEWLVQPLRDKGADILALTAFGPVPEPAVAIHPELVDPIGDLEDRRVERETKTRMRAWIDTEAGRYQKIVLLAYGPMMRYWTEAASGTPAAKRTTVIVVPTRTGLRDTIMRRRLQKAITT